MKAQIKQAVDLIVGDTWPKRRRVVYLVLAFCAAVIAFCLGAATAAMDMAAVMSIANNAFWLGGMVVGSYVFGSIWDDNDKRKHGTAAPPAAPASTAPSPAPDQTE